MREQYLNLSKELKEILISTGLSSEDISNIDIVSIIEHYLKYCVSEENIIDNSHIRLLDDLYNEHEMEFREVFEKSEAFLKMLAAV